MKGFALFVFKESISWTREKGIVLNAEYESMKEQILWKPE
jgi:hypothetical protein